MSMDMLFFLVQTSTYNQAAKTTKILSMDMEFYVDT